MATPAADDIARVVVLVRGAMEQGGSYWCYVAVKPSRAEEFQQAVARNYNIQHFAADGYGEIVVSGPGDTPPEDVTAQVATLFGVPVDSLVALIAKPAA